MTEQTSLLITNRLEGVTQRLRYQHEFAVEGFKALVLINGGAIIALLTYAGHNSETRMGDSLSGAFLGYVAGLIAAVLAYLAAYSSQSTLMQHDMLEAYRLLGVEAADGSNAETYALRGTMWVYAGIVLSMLSLCGFIAGSWMAMSALS